MTAWPTPTDDTVQMVMDAAGVDRDEATRALIEGRAMVRVEGRDYRITLDGKVVLAGPPNPTTLAW